MPTYRGAKIAHATYYARFAALLEQKYRIGGGDGLHALQQFDEERTQIDAAWEWLRGQTPIELTDRLLLMFADSTVYLGDLRYHKKTERIPQFELTLKVARRMGSSIHELSALGNLGTAYGCLGDAPRALDYHTQRRDLARSNGNRRIEGVALSNLGNVYADLGDMSQAMECYQQHLEILQEVPDRRGEGIVYGNLGNIYQNTGKYAKALQYFEKSLAASRDIQDIRGEGQCQLNMGSTFYGQGNLLLAREAYAVALSLSRQIGDRALEGNALSGFGVVAYAIGDFEVAKEYFTACLTLFREIGDNRTASIILLNLADTHVDLKDIEQAQLILQESEANVTEVGGQWLKGAILNGKGRLALLLSNSELARKLLEDACKVFRDMNDPASEGMVSLYLGDAYHDIGDEFNSLAAYEHARTIADELGNALFLAKANWAIGSWHVFRGDFTKAIVYLQKCVDIELRSGCILAKEHQSELVSIQKQIGL